MFDSGVIIKTRDIMNFSSKKPGVFLCFFLIFGFTVAGQDIRFGDLSGWRSTGKLQVTANNNEGKIISLESRSGKPTFFTKRIKTSKQSPLYFKVLAKSLNNGNASVYFVARDKKMKWQTWSFPETIKLNGNWRQLNAKFYPLKSTEYVDIVLAVKKASASFKAPSLKIFSPISDAVAGQVPLEYWVNVDYGDQVLWSRELGYDNYDEKEIDNLFKKLKSANVTGVLWRVSMCGQFMYPSKEGTMFPGKTSIDKLDRRSKKLALILKKIDPLKTAIKKARENKIKIYIWMTISDEEAKLKGVKNYAMSEFLSKNPQFCLLDKSENPMRGTLCYFIPEVRNYRLRIIKELLGYKADGIYLCTRTHAWMFNTDRNYKYGYNKPIVDEYKKRYGKNILKENFDKNKWLELRAEGLDIFVKEASALIHKSKQKFMFGIKSLGSETLGHPYDKAKMHWKKWITGNLVDSVLVGHYLVSDYMILRDTIKFKKLANKNQKIYFWGQINHYQERKCRNIGKLKSTVTAATFSGANGVMFHEFFHMEEPKYKNDYLIPLKDFFEKINSNLSQKKKQK